MDLEHLPEVVAIEEASFPTPWSLFAFTYEVMQNNFAHYIVALDRRQVVGYAGVWVIMDEAHITNVAVHPQCRGRRVGLHLMEELMKRVASIGVDRMTLEVRPSNIVARNLYEILGFTECGRRKGYYSDNHEDAIIMWKSGLVKQYGGQGSDRRRVLNS
ncbi:MAG: ribosomal-protein-alanine N-acetyltransferase [Peptococcaceae bacterium]|nr:MAG: ribosomal-protein-alanine N-acetyltransferase [Peptococcaceae bacterium]